PANVRYVGPQLDDPAWFAPWEPAPWGNDNLPLVLVSLSTTYQQQADVIRRVIVALAELPVRGLVTLGPALDSKRSPLPSNVRVEPYAPHVLICPHADLVITHGGHGTVITALKAGVPLVCLPMGRDQADNAARVVWRGAGVRRSSKADALTLRRAIQQVLGEPRFRESAQRIASGIAHDVAPTQAIAELENLASPLARVSE
ncbi:MAG TPA: nucleotide disphospho-sugar-binding domain-containing protein, partial [Ktedonobacterales bacterium]|nr:nucleotide disphospho-sugar-binding domain-containing protein [Ktedonobacterales bacterium]